MRFFSFKKITIAFFTLFLLLNFVLPSNIVLAGTADDSYGLNTTASQAGLQGGENTSLAEIIGRIIGLFLSFLGVIFFTLIVYGGFMWMTAGGKTDQVDKAKRIISNAVVGLVIVLLSYVITHLVVSEVSQKVTK